jgi:hypothetical protein
MDLNHRRIPFVLRLSKHEWLFFRTLLGPKRESSLRFV